MTHKAVDPQRRFPPLAPESWPAALDPLRTGFAAGLNVYRVMAHHPALLIAWQTFRDHVVLRNSLDAGSLEIVILRTGFRRDSVYEWMQHVVRARKAGLDDERIRSAALPPGTQGMREDGLLIRCVDALIDYDRLDTDLQGAVASRFGKEGVLDVIATVGMYSLLAYIIRSFDTPIDGDIEAALAGDPLKVAGVWT